MKEFVNEQEADALAQKAIEDYMDKCNCKNIQDARLASQKMVGVAMELMKTLHDPDMNAEVVQ